ncbi:MAG: 3-methyl-2-oxobutanoate hydroxymethyltransferase [Caldilineaceae bacterium]|nr:3-methyl-2-oxobutanoate hydroxymethyltransferase [Caldilineaceae bacterium]
MSTQTTAAPKSTRSKITVRTLQQRKDAGQPITMITAYDYTSAVLADGADIDVLLVGDSLGMVVLGYESTVQVTMDEMIHHCKAVARGSRTSLLVGDLPFLSYQITPEEALRNAGRLLSEGHMEAVKLEGGIAMAATIERIVTAGIPVVGHIGLTPQSVNLLGYRAQGRTAKAARRLLDDALAVERAGCSAIVLEAVPDRLAAHISQQLTIPTIGIGAGNGCDGQVLVYHDMLGLFDRMQPRFVKQYATLAAPIQDALRSYAREVRDRSFPGAEHTYAIPDDEWNAFLTGLDGEE